MIAVQSALKIIALFSVSDFALLILIDETCEKINYMHNACFMMKARGRKRPHQMFFRTETAASARPSASKTHHRVSEKSEKQQGSPCQWGKRITSADSEGQSLAVDNVISTS
jgi:hypothetical protein